MKKLAYVMVALALIVALVPATVTAHTEDDPSRTDLMAGQDIDAGDVLVWNDGGNLYVKFEAADGWCIAETHVAVGASPEEIPQTKKENPIPGKFLNSALYSPCEESPDPYVIPLEWAGGDTIYVAAHAAVVQPIDGCYETMWQIGDVEAPSCDGLPTNYADEFNWADPAGPCTAGPSLAVNEPAFTTPFIVGSTQTSEFPYNSNYNRGYATDFDVQWDGELHFGGELTVSWSPGQSATEKKVVSDGFSPATFTAVGTPTPGGFLDTYPVVQHSVTTTPLPMGTHTINFRHTQGDGTFWDWIRLEKPCEQWETGWGNGTSFDGANWAMYFTYTVQQPVCPSISDMSANIDLLDSPPEDVRVGYFENDTYVRIWQEFVGPLPADLYFDLEEGRSARTDGPSAEPLNIAAGEYVCSYYVHLDNVGPSSTVQKTSYVEFETDVLGLIISGGNLGTFADRNLMFASDDSIGYSGTTYPDDSVLYPPNVDYLRGFDVNYGSNLDDAVFNGNVVDFTMWVVNAHDSMRIILPALPQ
jgi:hypothetical protein